MKKNAFYFLTGCVAILLLVIFWYSVEADMPLLIEAAFVVAVTVLWYSRTRITDLIEDERSARITEKAALRTMQVFWVVFCAFSIGAVIQILDTPAFPPSLHAALAPPHRMAILPMRNLGYIQLGLLCLMIFLYAGIRMYYARKFGDWDTDEE